MESTVAHAGSRGRRRPAAPHDLHIRRTAKAIDEARGGDTLVLTAGVTYTGNFTLPAKPRDNEEFITIRSSAIDQLPANTRVKPAAASKMPQLVTPNTAPAISIETGAHHWRLQGLELTVGEGVYVYDVVRVGYLETADASRQPREIELDRLYIHGDPARGGKRGIFLNTNAVRLLNSWISGFKSDSQDAMAIAACNGFGPYEINNNYLEGAGYGIIFGGCNNAIPEVAPSDVTFTRNYVYKPLEWQRLGKWVCKNLFEVKLGRRMRIEGNVFENNWVGAQNGFGILFTVRADSKDARGEPFGVIEDVTFADNLIINSAQGVNISGKDDITRNLGRTAGLVFHNNLFLKVPGRLFQFTNGPTEVTIEHNTSTDNGTLIMSEGVTKGLVMQDNIFGLGEFGIAGSGSAQGDATLARNFPRAVVRFNGFIGDPLEIYPRGNRLANKVEDVRFVNPEAGDFRLQPKSRFRGRGRNGSDPGVDMDRLEAATRGVVEGRGQR